jgi:hypothetical protein
MKLRFNYSAIRIPYAECRTLKFTVNLRIATSDSNVNVRVSYKTSIRNFYMYNMCEELDGPAVTRVRSRKLSNVGQSLDG